MIRNVMGCLVCVVVVSLTGHVFAGNFKVVPIKVYFENGEKVRTLSLQNESDDDVTLQLEVMEWTQDAEGKDLYAPSKVLAIFPSILTVKARSDRAIKIGYQGPPSTSGEQTFRLYLNELPVEKEGHTSLQMAMRLGLPVFVVPQKGRGVLVVERAVLHSGQAEIYVTNSGNQHLYVKSIGVSAKDNAGDDVVTGEVAGWYLLAGARRVFQVPLDREPCPMTKELRVVVTFSGRDSQPVPVTGTYRGGDIGCRHSLGE